MSRETPRLSLATVCLSGTLEDKLDAAAVAGFDGVEIFAPDLVADPLPPAGIGARCRDLGLSIDLYQPLRDIDSTDPDRFAANLRRAEATFDVMAGLAKDGMTMIVVTHEMGFARKAANRVVFMADGRIVEEATPEEFFTNPKSDRAKDFLSKLLTH